MSPTLPRGPIDLGNRLLVLPGEGSELTVASMPGWTLLHTPGHTPGHVSFFREADRTLIVGDAFCTTPAESFFAANFTQPAELHGPPSYFTSDWQAAKSSVRQLAALHPEAVAPGHGKPLSGTGVASALQTLAENFDHVALPDNVREDKKPARKQAS
jgi:glyoxylase-like metal-dependent hydrolase (beta-lactamase superfamily II)